VILPLMWASWISLMRSDMLSVVYSIVLDQLHRATISGLSPYAANHDFVHLVMLIVAFTHTTSVSSQLL
jgi:hypothetical protein